MNIEKIRSIPQNIRVDIRSKLLDEQFSNKYCKKCGLYSEVRNPYIEGRGNKNSKLLILGEGPGEEEDKQGQPFVGKSGHILQERLNKFNIDCYLSNGVRCRSTDTQGKNRKPTPTEIKCCIPFTVQLIKEMQPKVIVTLGNIPTNQILNNNLGITVCRGKKFYHPEFKCYVIPTYHPSYLARINDHILYTQFEEDLYLANSLVYTPPIRTIESRPSTLIDPVDINDYLKSILNKKAVAVDLETTGLNSKVDRITDISFCYEVGKGIHIKWENIIPHMELLKEVMASNVDKIGHNFIFDKEFLESVGIKVNNFKFDTMLAEHTLTMSMEGKEINGLYKLKTMAWYYTNCGGYESVLGEGGIKSFIKTKTVKKKKKETEEDIENFMNTEDTELDKCYSFVDSEKVKKLSSLGIEPLQYYSAMDADTTYKVYLKQKPLIDKDYSFIFYEIIIPLAPVLNKMKLNGIKLDLDYMNKVFDENVKEAAELEADIYKKAKRKFDIDSPKQLADIIFKVFKVKPNDDYKTPKGAYSVDVEAIKFYSKKNKNLERIVEYRKLNKQNSTYITGFKKFMDEKTHRVYASYLQHSTATGRLSCINPPIQTIPRDNKIRNMIIPSEGNKLLVSDLSQIELRILAMLSKDPNMIEAFNSGMDFHSATACKMFNIDPEIFDKKNNPKHAACRDASKTINFGIIYGQSAYALADSLKIDVKEAQNFIDTWFKTYSNIQRWMNGVIAFTKRNGYIETLYGRKRWLPMIHSSDKKIQAAATRRAINTVVQSSAGDINNIALIRTQNWLDETNKKSMLVAAVHDSVLIDAVPEEVEEISIKIMEFQTKDIPRITIPLVSDVQILDRWIK
jgi:DNA polymerase-1